MDYNIDENIINVNSCVVLQQNVSNKSVFTSIPNHEIKQNERTYSLSILNTLMHNFFIRCNKVGTLVALVLNTLSISKVRIIIMPFNNRCTNADQGIVIDYGHSLVQRKLVGKKCEDLSWCINDVEFFSSNNTIITINNRGYLSSFAINGQQLALLVINNNKLFNFIPIDQFDTVDNQSSISKEKHRIKSTNKYHFAMHSYLPMVAINRHFNGNTKNNMLIDINNLNDQIMLQCFVPPNYTIVDCLIQIWQYTIINCKYTSEIPSTLFQMLDIYLKELNEERTNTPLFSLIKLLLGISSNWLNCCNDNKNSIFVIQLIHFICKKLIIISDFYSCFHTLVISQKYLSYRSGEHRKLFENGFVSQSVLLSNLWKMLSMEMLKDPLTHNHLLEISLTYSLPSLISTPEIFGNNDLLKQGHYCYLDGNYEQAEMFYINVTTSNHIITNYI